MGERERTKEKMRSREKKSGVAIKYASIIFWNRAIDIKNLSSKRLASFYVFARVAKILNRSKFYSNPSFDFIRMIDLMIFSPIEISGKC